MLRGVSGLQEDPFNQDSGTSPPDSGLHRETPEALESAGGGGGQRARAEGVEAGHAREPRCAAIHRGVLLLFLEYMQVFWGGLFCNLLVVIP